MRGVFGDAAKTERRAIRLIGIERGGPTTLGEFSSRQAAQAVHLPKPVLRRRIALREQDIVERYAGDVRSSQGVACNGDRTVYEGLDRTGSSGKGAVNIPVNDT
jgi:hypothetical protein